MVLSNKGVSRARALRICRLILQRFIIGVCFVGNVAHVRDALMDMMADESFHLPTEANHTCLTIAKAMSSNLKSSSEDSSVFCAWLVNQLEQIVSESFSETTSHINRDKLWSSFYQFQVSTLLQEKWTSYLHMLELPAKPIFFQTCTSILFDIIIKTKFPVPDATQTPPEVFSFEEENAIRYVGGYVVAALKKRETDVEILAGLDHLTEKNPKAVSNGNSATWVQEITRGGLILITEEAQDVFISIEACTKANLTVNKAHTLDDTTRHHLKNELYSDSDVQFYWCLTGITLKIDDLKAEELLELCIDQWISIRGNSLGNSIQEFYKQQTKKGTEKSKPLRKTIE